MRCSSMLEEAPHQENPHTKNASDTMPALSSCQPLTWSLPQAHDECKALQTYRLRPLQPGLQLVPAAERKPSLSSAGGDCPGTRAGCPKKIK